MSFFCVFQVACQRCAKKTRRDGCRVDAKNAFDGYIHSMRSATEGSGDNKGLSEKMDSEEKAWHGNIKVALFSLGHPSYIHRNGSSLDVLIDCYFGLVGLV